MRCVCAVVSLPLERATFSNALRYLYEKPPNNRKSGNMWPCSDANRALCVCSRQSATRATATGARCVSMLLVTEAEELVNEAKQILQMNWVGYT